MMDPTSLQNPFFTYIIILVVVICSIIGFKNFSLFNRWVFSIRGIFKNAQIYRILSSIFIHVNGAHLIFNMISFYSFASFMEKKYPSLLIPLLFFSGGILGNLLALLIKRKELNYTAAGASGGVASIIFSSIFLVPETKIMIFPIFFPIPAWAFAIIFLGITIFGLDKENTSIGHEAHLGGALTGVLITYLFSPQAILANLMLSFIVAAAVVITFLYLILKKN